MNNLVATWHLPKEVDLAAASDPRLLLARVRDALTDIPELDHVRRLVDDALEEVTAWCCGEQAVTSPVRLPSGSNAAR